MSGAPASIRRAAVPLRPGGAPARKRRVWRCPVIKFATLGMVAATAGAVSQNAWAEGDAPISISLSNYAFTPGEIALKSGAAYHLRFTNSGSKDHDFSAPEFFAASQVAAKDQAKLQKGQVALESGQPVDITLMPGRPGTYAFECTHFMHKMMGMHGSIVVQ
jgi:plastocyanin